jgi:hypothetical protein
MSARADQPMQLCPRAKELESDSLSPTQGPIASHVSKVGTRYPRARTNVSRQGTYRRPRPRIM